MNIKSKTNILTPNKTYHTQTQTQNQMIQELTNTHSIK